MDPACLNPKHSGVDVPWDKVVTDEDGKMTEMVPPALLIPFLVFHPALWPTGYRRAAPVHNAAGQRVYGHPMTCDMAIAAQAVVDAKPAEVAPSGQPYRHRLTPSHHGIDGTEVEREESWTAHHIKVANTAKEHWFKRHSKATYCLHTRYTYCYDLSPEENRVRRQRFYHRSLALPLVVLEVAARHGIHCHHSGLEEGERDWVLWPICWLFLMDRADQSKFTGVHRAPGGEYAPSRGWECDRSILPSLFWNIPGIFLTRADRDMSGEWIIPGIFHCQPPPAPPAKAHLPLVPARDWVVQPVLRAWQRGHR